MRVYAYQKFLFENVGNAFAFDLLLIYLHYAVIIYIYIKSYECWCDWSRFSQNYHTDTFVFCFILNWIGKKEGLLYNCLKYLKYQTNKLFSV